MTAARFLAASIIVVLAIFMIVSLTPNTPTKVVLAPPIPTAEEIESRKELEQKAAEAHLAQKAAIEKEFKANRPHIMKMLRDLMNIKGYIAAVAWGERFAEIEDEEFQKLYLEARRLNGMQQTEMKKKMDAKAARQASLQKINVAAENMHAISYCQNLVKAELKSPTEAKFPWDTDVKTVGGNERFIVHSYVDAPNSYNAITRTRYFCRLQYDGGGTSGWNVEEFRIGG